MCFFAVFFSFKLHIGCFENPVFSNRIINKVRKVKKEINQPCLLHYIGRVYPVNLGELSGFLMRK